MHRGGKPGAGVPVESDEEEAVAGGGGGVSDQAGSSGPGSNPFRGPTAEAVEEVEEEGVEVGQGQARNPFKQ
jgi:hypothetical protein